MLDPINDQMKNIFNSREKKLKKLKQQIADDVIKINENGNMEFIIGSSTVKNKYHLGQLGPNDLMLLKLIRYAGFTVFNELNVEISNVERTIVITERRKSDK